MHKVAFTLLIIGGLNWLLEVFGWGIGRFIPEMVANVVYVLVGLSAIYLIATHKKTCKDCTTPSNGGSTPMQDSSGATQ
ncbi:MAG: DUF378 domain-containing protein [Candidatus Paceibacterota bacterium]